MIICKYTLEVYLLFPAKIVYVSLKCAHFIKLLQIQQNEIEKLKDMTK